MSARMPRRMALAMVVAGLAACATEEGTVDPSLAVGGGGDGFEVWIVDQSNTTGLAYGGRIEIHQGKDLQGAAGKTTPERVDLAGATAALCLASTGANPVRPHMLFFNADHRWAVLSFVASGHVVFFDAASRAPVACFRSSPGAGGARQAHAATPSPDDAFVLVSNQNGKRLERIRTDYAAGAFAQEPAATLDLASCTTPSGAACEDAALRPDNAPICSMIDRAGRLAFITLRGGGHFVVDPAATPMRIVGEYDRATVHPHGCGGIQAAGAMWITSGGGSAHNLSEFDLYRFPLTGYAPSNPPNVPAPETVLSLDHLSDRDSHGVVATKHDRYLWVADRSANVIEVVETATGAHAGTVPLAGPLSDDPTPDLLDIAPGGGRIFVSLRGPVPLSGDPHVSTGSTPGLGVIRVEGGGRSGTLAAIVRMSNVDATGVERADPHAVRVRRK